MQFMILFPYLINKIPKLSNKPPSPKQYKTKNKIRKHISLKQNFNQDFLNQYAILLTVVLKL